MTTGCVNGLYNFWYKLQKRNQLPLRLLRELETSIDALKAYWNKDADSDGVLTDDRGNESSNKGKGKVSNPKEDKGKGNRNRKGKGKGKEANGPSDAGPSRHKDNHGSEGENGNGSRNDQKGGMDEDQRREPESQGNGEGNEQTVDGNGLRMNKNDLEKDGGNTTIRCGGGIVDKDSPAGTDKMPDTFVETLSTYDGYQRALRLQKYGVSALIIVLNTPSSSCRTRRFS